MVLYYANASTYLVDKSVADISPVAAVGISLAILIVGWFVYDGALSRLLEGRDRSSLAARWRSSSSWSPSARAIS